MFVLMWYTYIFFGVFSVIKLNCLTALNFSNSLVFLKSMDIIYCKQFRLHKGNIAVHFSLAFLNQLLISNGPFATLSIAPINLSGHGVTELLPRLEINSAVLLFYFAILGWEWRLTCKQAIIFDGAWKFYLLLQVCF